MPKNEKWPIKKLHKIKVVWDPQNGAPDEVKSDVQGCLRFVIYVAFQKVLFCFLMDILYNVYCKKCYFFCRGVHVFQHDVAMLKELRLRRLKRLLEAKERSSQAAQEAQ